MFARLSRRMAESRAVQACVCGLTSLVLALALFATPPFLALERQSFDIRVSLLAKPGRATNDIALVVLDQASLDWGDTENGLSWPWPREMYAVILNFCARAGAATVSLDVLFTEPSFYGVEDDRVLGDAVRRNGRAVLAAFPGQGAGNARAWPARFAAPPSAVPLPSPPFPAFASANFPVPEAGSGAAALGSVNQPPDTDGIYRHVGLLSRFGNDPLPSLAFAAYLLHNPGVTVRQREGTLVIEPGAGLPGNPVHIAVDGRGGSLLNYRGRGGTHAAFRASDVIRSELLLREGAKPVIDPAVLRGKHVLFGFTAPGLLDLRPAPVGGVFTGLEVQATALDNLLSGDFMREVPLVVTVALVALFSCIATLSAVFLTRASLILLTGAVTLAMPPLLAGAAYTHGWWLPLTPVMTGAVTAFLMASAYGYAREGHKRRFLKKAFARYLSNDIIEDILKEPERLKLGGERQVLSIFFADLAGFTALAEALRDPEAVTGVLSEYTQAMTAIIFEEGGTLDKYVGDGIVAFWNAPGRQKDHAARAVRAAIRCQRAIAEMRDFFIEHAGGPVSMRVGVHTGEAVVGNIGSNERFAYTMIGDAVNLASRLEGLNKFLGTGVIISRDTASRLDSTIVARDLGNVAVAGRNEPVNVFEPMFREEAEAREKELAVFEKALAASRLGDLAGAGRLFASVADADGAARAYLALCEEGAAGTPGEWDGVVRFGGK